MTIDIDSVRNGVTITYLNNHYVQKSGDTMNGNLEFADDGVSGYGITLNRGNIHLVDADNGNDIFINQASQELINTYGNTNNVIYGLDSGANFEWAIGWKGNGLGIYGSSKCAIYVDGVEVMLFLSTINYFEVDSEFQANCQVNNTLTVLGQLNGNSFFFNSDGSISGELVCSGNLSIAGSMMFEPSINITFHTSGGTKIGTSTSEKFAFHNATPVVQRSGAAQAAVATTGATNITPYGFTTAAQADAIITLLNEIRASLVEKGLIKGAA